MDGRRQQQPGASFRDLVSRAGPMIQPDTVPVNSDCPSLGTRQNSVPAHRRIESAVFLGLFAAALGPTLWFGIPAAMADYPNHLARMFILSRIDGADPNPFYQADWALYPNLAMDLLVPFVAKSTGVEIATRLFYLASQILVVTGVMAMEYAVKRRIAIAGTVALIFLYSPPFAWGFVNLEFALGCAFWGIALALFLDERHYLQRFLLHSVAIAWLYVAHIFALGIYGFTIGIHELWRAYARRTPLRELAARLAALAVPTLALMGAIRPWVASAHAGSTIQWHLGAKALWIMLVANGYSLAVSAISVAAVAIAVRLLARQRAIRFQSAGAWLAAAFGLLFLAMPFRIFDGTFADLRVIVAATLIMPCFLSVSFPNENWHRLTLVGIAAIIAINLLTVLMVWTSYRVDYAAMMDSFRLLPKRSVVLVGHSGKGADPPRDLTEFPVYHLPSLAAHYADAYVSDLFAEPGKQPIAPRESWRRLSTANIDPVPVNLLKAVAEHKALVGVPNFIRTWTQDYNYLYLVGPSIQNPMPGILDPVFSAPRFTLYRIRKSSAGVSSN